MNDHEKEKRERERERERRRRKKGTERRRAVFKKAFLAPFPPIPLTSTLPSANVAWSPSSTPPSLQGCVCRKGL